MDSNGKCSEHLQADVFKDALSLFPWVICIEQSLQLNMRYVNQKDALFDVEFCGCTRFMESFTLLRWNNYCCKKDWGV